MTWVRARLCKLQEGCTRLASDKVVDQLLALVGGSLQVLWLLPPLKLVAAVVLSGYSGFFHH